MKYNNKKVIKNHKYFFMGILLILLVRFYIIIDLPILSARYQFSKYIFLVLSFLLIIYVFMVREYFEYDSTGQVLIIKNTNIIKHGILPERIKGVELPKRKLNRFKIKNYIIHTSLNLYIHSKDKGIVKKSFNITHLSRNRRYNLSKSLEKIISENTLDT